MAEVHDLSVVVAEIAVPEKEIADVEVGRRVVLKARAYSTEEFEGHVVAVAPAVSVGEAASRQLEKIFRVTTRIENPGMRLKPGMTGHAKIDCGRRRLADLVLRRSARYLRVEFWSFW